MGSLLGSTLSSFSYSLSASSTSSAADSSNTPSQDNMAANHRSIYQREIPSLVSTTSPPPSAQSDLTPSSSATNSAILSTNFHDYSLNRLAAYRPLLKPGIFVTDRPAWSQSRALLRRIVFAKTQIADLSTFEGLITDLLLLLPTDGQPIDLQGVFLGYAIDSATAVLFGRWTHTLRRLGSPAAAGANHQENVDFADVFNDAQAAIRTREQLGALRVFHRDKHAVTCIRICHEFVEGAIEDALRRVPGGTRPSHHAVGGPGYGVAGGRRAQLFGPRAGAQGHHGRVRYLRHASARRDLRVRCGGVPAGAVEGLQPGEWAFLPLGGGPRGCLGQQHALTKWVCFEPRYYQRPFSPRNVGGRLSGCKHHQRHSYYYYQRCCFKPE
ncbi:uncharacterized protein BO66DRAFT_397311 [Aspergillus aculeatinus CBS 121060]|uniref:Uncharacterized protein n=1 Tax=Aspergillus aculeatinus CBS 121060 TaxID=1448322 RepID=A0ACD1HQ99_9EURO|nr:hypothetical protein BO66DRAFT_397311 [Aspergillus aculeatinus CBS 121060]RAH75724.1 hypothetical protein BO66DRAFT_397311 [Aspergillus aculeatinus CBS 121060]